MSSKGFGVSDVYLSMDISTHCHRGGNRLNIRLFQQQVAHIVAQPLQREIQQASVTNNIKGASGTLFFNKCGTIAFYEKKKGLA